MCFQLCTTSKTLSRSQAKFLKNEILVRQSFCFVLLLTESILRSGFQRREREREIQQRQKFSLVGIFLHI